jgi:hypothetical protein
MSEGRVGSGAVVEEELAAAGAPIALEVVVATVTGPGGSGGVVEVDDGWAVTSETTSGSGGLASAWAAAATPSTAATPTALRATVVVSCAIREPPFTKGS